REHRDAIQRAAGRHQACGRDQAEARLEADDVVEHGRYTAAARGVGAECERHQSGRYGDARPRARSARNEIGTYRIDGNAVGRADADEPGGELVEIGLADDDGAGRPQLRRQAWLRAGSFGHGYPVAGGLSQSAVNDNAGARTPVALLICSVTLALCLLFFTGLLTNLPKAVLAAIVFAAVYRL
ncbi:hypothetical protein KXV85_003025, partial [Aspergillus fumigatus]